MSGESVVGESAEAACPSRSVFECVRCCAAFRGGSDTLNTRMLPELSSSPRSKALERREEPVGITRDSFFRPGF